MVLMSTACPARPRLRDADRSGNQAGTLVEYGNLSTTATVDDPRISGDDGILLPARAAVMMAPVRDAGLRNAFAPGAPWAACRADPVLMLLSRSASAYVVRQGLPTLDPRTNALVRDWIPVALPKLLLVNTGVLILSSVFMELARTPD